MTTEKPSPAKYPIIHNGDHAEYEIENAGKPPEERSDWPLPSFDARDWARAFLKTYDTADDDFLCEETMIGWFANALMRGYDERSGRDPACSSSHPEIRYQGETCPLCEALREAGSRFDEILKAADTGIPFYSYGDNEAACGMSNRLQQIAVIATCQQSALSRPSEAHAPMPCFCGGRAVLGPLPQDGGDAEVQFGHATGCPRDVGPGAGEEGKQ